ncbi:carbohydrate porin [Flammeovirga agarivorans]|uniref:Carbohydrate porin n=1 Tax=Flammeovirga agarivorans TaxID=2726742 RepID=A0A7X8SGM6_9BACT|nr:carbohydrate porin [Flammeovirga agarivorans]NLR89878.1 carbohydrate porin [Flammeovirga agarivorans]
MLLLIQNYFSKTIRYNISLWVLFIIYFSCNIPEANAQWFNANTNKSTEVYLLPSVKSDVLTIVDSAQFLLVFDMEHKDKFIKVWDIESDQKGYALIEDITINNLLEAENIIKNIHSTHANHDSAFIYIRNTTIDSMMVQLGKDTVNLAPDEMKNITLDEGEYLYWAIQKETIPDYGYIYIPDSSDLMLQVGQEFNENKMLEMELDLMDLKDDPEFTMYKRSFLDTVQVSKRINIQNTKSGYDRIQMTGGSKSVDADLLNDDMKKDAWVNVKPMDKPLDTYYDFKRYIQLKYNVAIGMDYMFLGQHSSYVKSGSPNAASGIYRFFGTWEPVNTKDTQGGLIFKIENRHSLTPTAPRHLGYESGSALSTASFKDMGWGLTNLYWRQSFKNNKYGFVLGIMDPGDFIDLFPLLNPYKCFLSEAFFNNPAMAIPNQGIGGAFLAKDLIKNTYVAGGFHDANGEPTNFISNSFKSFAKGEYLYWVELGWNTHTPFLNGENIHVTYWYQDARTDSEGNLISNESQGICFSASTSIHKTTLFSRLAYSQGDGALMRYMVMAGCSYNIVKDDQIGIGVDLGAPVDPEIDESQLGIELYYNMQLTEHVNISPDVQVYINPVYNQEKNAVAIFSFRLRYAL